MFLCCGGYRDSSVCIAARYGLDGPGIESRWGRDFPHPSIPALGLTQPPVQWVSGLSPGVKRPGRGDDHPPPPKCRGHERVGLYLYSPSGPSWPVIGWTLPFTSCVVEPPCGSCSVPYILFHKTHFVSAYPPTVPHFSLSQEWNPIHW